MLLLKPRFTKIKNRTDKRLVHTYDANRKHKYGGPQLSRQKQFSLVFVYFYSKFYSLPNDFWFRPLLRFSVTSRDHNLEMKSPTIFCLAEVIDSTVLLSSKGCNSSQKGIDRLHHLSLSDFLPSISVFLIIFLV